MEVKGRIPEPAARASRRAVAVAVSFPPTFPLMVARTAHLYRDKVFLPRRHSRGGEPVTFGRLAEDVARLAAGLCSLGIERGDRVGIVAENGYAWLLADLAASYFGAVDVPRGVDTAPAEMEFILAHSESRLAFVENDQLARELLARRDAVPALQQVCSLAEVTAIEGVLTLPQLIARGEAWQRRNPGAIEARADRVRPDDLLTIVYTSGTTAEPKGVMLTHQNVLSNVRTANHVFDFGPQDRFLSALPPWHMYERMMDYTAFAFGAEIVYTDRRRLKDDLRDMHPTLFAAVPRIWESIHDGIVGHCQKLPARQRALMQHVLGICRRVGAGKPRLLDRLLYPCLRATLLRRFQRIAGGRLRVAVSGGGSLPAHVDETLLGIGLPLVNGYGLTETSPVVSVRAPHANRCGTIGQPLPETEVQIRDEDGNVLPAERIGLIWIRGPGVMQGYYKNPTRTATVLVGGWFNSGDLGCIDRHGHVRITGRAKDTIVLASGENVEPEPVETAIKTSSYVEQAVVLGQDQKGVGALLVVATDCLEQAIPRERWGIEGPLLKGPEVHALLRRELDHSVSRANGFRPADRVTAFRALHEPMTPDNGLLTQTLKVRRHVVVERFGELIREMFAREG